MVTRAKKARSDLRGGQGREPRRPMPRVGVVATIRVRGKGGAILGEDGWDIVWVKEAVRDVEDVVSSFFRQKKGNKLDFGKR